MIRAVLFDFDGTITRPEALDFAALRTALGCPAGTTILEYIDALPTKEERKKAHVILADFEQAAARASMPNPGAEEAVALLKDRGIRLGILTRNTLASIRESLKNFRGLTEADFSVIITRESAGRPKPHPDGVIGAARQLGVAPGEMLVVGDFIFDIAAGKAAGSPTVLVTNGRTAPDSRAAGAAWAGEAKPDYTIGSLSELATLLEL
jgi:HAD superfamily hydrolase (TIGR01509 family)